MKRLGWIVLIVLAPALGAQVPDDSGAAQPPTDAAQAERLRSQILQRWNDHVRSTLGLSDEQATKLQATEQRFEAQRQPVRAHQRELNQALRAELAAGTPNQDRVRQLMNEQQENQLTLQRVNRDEDREIQAYLTPVQRARYHEERRRFQERIHEAILHRREQRRQQVIGPRGRAGGGARRRPPL